MKKKLIVSICLGSAMILMGDISYIALANESLEKDSVIESNKVIKNVDNSFDEKDKIINVKKVENKENIDNLDDKDLEITMEEFLNNKESNKELYKNNDNIEQREVELEKSLNIIETNFKWNGNLDFSNNPKSIVLHHIEASRPGSTIPVTDVHQWHLNNGWTGIGYHFYITKDGRIYRGRPENAIGAHAAGKNVNTLGIAVEGKYQSESMPQAQRDSIIKVGEYLRRKYKIATVLGHKEVNSTSCPGKNYPLDSIRNEILKAPIEDTINKKPLVDQSFRVKYAAHGQDYDWQGYVEGGQIAGTTGQFRRMEAIKINLENAPQDLGISYRTHSEGDSGWREWKNNDQVSGTVGEAKRMEGIQIKLTGKMAKNYSVEYRAHVEDYEWQPWVRDGETAGTLGEWKRIEAIEIRVVKNNAFGIEYSGQGEDYGWQSYVNNGQLAGTSGQYRRLEALKMNLTNAPVGVGLRYREHVEGEGGFGEWKNSNQIAGTVGEYKRLEAIQLELTGVNSNKYDIEYRTHVENYGWQPWVKNGQTAGTLGEWKRVEGIEIRILEK